MDDDEKESIAHEFRNVVNMTPSTLDHWLATAKSGSAG